MGSGAHKILATSFGHLPHDRHMAASLMRSAANASEATSRTTASHDRSEVPCAISSPCLPGGLFRSGARERGYGHAYNQKSVRVRRFLRNSYSVSHAAGSFSPPDGVVACEAVAGVGSPTCASRHDLSQESGCRRTPRICQALVTPRRRRPLEPGRYAPTGSRQRVLNRQSNPGVDGLHVSAPSLRQVHQ